MAVFLSASKLGTKPSGYRKDKSLSMHDILWCKGEKDNAILTLSGRSKVQTTESLHLHVQSDCLSSSMLAVLSLSFSSCSCKAFSNSWLVNTKDQHPTKDLTSNRFKHVQTSEIKSSLSKRPSLFLSNSLKASAPVTCSHVGSPSSRHSILGSIALHSHAAMPQRCFFLSPPRH